MRVDEPASVEAPAAGLDELERELVQLRADLVAARQEHRESTDFFDNATVPLHWVGPDGTILRANQAELDLLGYARSEYVGRNVTEFHLERPVVDELLARLRAGDVVREFPSRLRCKDGSVRDVLIDSSGYRDSGRFIHSRCVTRDVTDQLRAEDDLHRNQARLRLAAQATQDLIWDWDLVNGRVAWEGPTDSFFPHRPGEPGLAGNPYQLWARRVHPDDLAVTEAASRAAFESGAESWKQEYRFRRADDSWAHILERAFVVRDARGKAVRAVGAMQDVSRRRETEEATTRLAAIVASSTDAIIGKTPDGIVTSWNAAAEQIFGYRASEIVGRSIFLLIPPELHHEEQSVLDQIRRGERVEFSETERIRKDGTRIYISVTVSPIRDSSGVVIGASSIKRDVTERKRAAAELARREERYRALVTATSSIVWTSDPEGRFSEPQPSWEEYTGQSWTEHAGFGWLDALHPDDRESVLAAWLRARTNRSILEARGRVWMEAHHRYRHFITRAAPVLAADGSVREWIGTVTDVENRWVAEERLRQAERMESVGRLAGGIAHEANNQMTVVLGASEFLLRRLQFPEAREDVEHIRRAAHRTAAITQQLLAFSRRQVLQPQIVDLNAVITSMQPILQRALGELSRLVLRQAADLGPVKADPGQLDQVLLNLTLNAKDAMPNGGVLTIETQNVMLGKAYGASKGVESLAPGPYAMIMVGDTGRGMDRATLDHIFEPFFTTKDVGEGTGLGLATVYGIVKQTGGFVWVYSEPGHGTAFKIYLPLFVSPAETTSAPVPAPAEGGSEVILLAEDEASVRAILARSLREYGYTVLEAVDGAEALELARQQLAPPALVIVDVVMPGMGGRELAEHLAARWPGIPVLFTSGYTGLDAVSRGLLQEHQNFMQKPLEPEALARMVRQMIDARRSPAQPT
ncbi:MAG TPA: PAS domain S-box protein [Gemmatimonadales bacterium]|nr:PAS domain S-box protein [Gemmatimonadales bacterium]